MTFGAHVAIIGLSVSDQGVSSGALTMKVVFIVLPEMSWSPVHQVVTPPAYRVAASGYHVWSVVSCPAVGMLVPQVSFTYTIAAS